MSNAPLLVLFVSGWGPGAAGPHAVFARLPKPFLGDLPSTYPLASLSAPADMDLRGIYQSFGQGLREALDQAALFEARIADPDRYGLLCGAMSGWPIPASKTRTDAFVPFPPGKDIKSGYPATIRLIQKQVSEFIAAGRSRLIFACFAGVWTASLYRDPAFLLEAAQETSQALLRLVDSALEQQFRVLICSDTSLLAPIDPGKTQPAQILPVLLVHPEVEGLRGSSHDRGHGQEIPVPATHELRQFAPTVAALLGLSLPNNAAAPLFADLISRTM